MIVTSIETGWQIIHHPTHAMLSVQIALQWKTHKRPVRWIETLTAIDTHDDHQPPWEGRNHLTEAGAPLNFRIRQYTVPEMNTRIGGARQKSRWNALLQSMHMAFLYQYEADEKPELTRIMAELETNRKRWRKSYGTTKAQELYAYEFMQFCDALSLVLVEGKLPIEERQIEVSKGPGGASYFAFQRADKTIGMAPWPFQEDEFAVHVESYPVSQLAFTDDDELFQALEQVDPVEMTWTFRR